MGYGENEMQRLPEGSNELYMKCRRRRGRQAMSMTSNTCRNCGGILVDEPLSEYNGNGTLDGTDRPLWLAYDGAKHFIRCQRCSATNIVIISKDPNGSPVLTISRAIMEDE